MIDKPLHDKLEEVFGFTEFRPLQKEIIKHTLTGANSLVLMPTGMGKSLCYQLPALISPALTLVISPLIALMKDQVDALQKKGVDATFINSSLGRSERIDRYKNLRAGAYKILYVTPERFRKDDFLAALKTREISLLAIDEAHCISEWGHDFRPDYTRLKDIRALLNNPTTIALTATATTDVQNDIALQLGLKASEMTIWHAGVERPNLHLGVSSVFGEKDKIELILELIKNSRGSKIIYFSLIKTLDRFSDLLLGKKTKHMLYHGKLSSDKRRKVQNAFMSGADTLVLATNAFGLGIDKSDIGLIIHAEVPGSLESYIQEIGRAGRDSKPANCELLYDQDDLLIQMEFVEWSNPETDYLEKVLSVLLEKNEQVNAMGIEFLREELVWKNRMDNRLETALNLLDRFSVTEGSLMKHNLSVCADLPEFLADPECREQKRKHDLLRLHKLVQYATLDSCRKIFVHNYFGFKDDKQCLNCDICDD
jgi:ATP-dependent DNA helicase RecQ